MPDVINRKIRKRHVVRDDSYRLVVRLADECVEEVVIPSLMRELLSIISEVEKIKLDEICSVVLRIKSPKVDALDALDVFIKTYFSYAIAQELEEREEKTQNLCNMLMQTKRKLER